MVWLLLLGLTFSLIITGGVKSYAQSKSLVDVPNSRSSHLVPTPRGGGLSIVLVVLVAIPILMAMQIVPWKPALGFVGAGALIALVGWLDDHEHIAARWRLGTHFLAAIWCLFWVGGLPPVVLMGFVIDFGWLGHVLAAIYLVWFLNLYNFMDGIDGIAGVEAVTVCIGGLIIYALASVGRHQMVLPILLMGAVLGFLFWNFPKAQIFMGDAGSGFVGFTLASISIQAAGINGELLWGWMILLGIFVVDATTALFRRVLRGDKFYEAHRSHAYQYLSRRLNSHVIVTLSIGVINLCWLLPLAMAVSLGWLDGVLGVFVAYIPLIGVAYFLKSGAAELQEV